jgi:cbb3-type cytochrome oxidase maturation protein
MDALAPLFVLIVIVAIFAAFGAAAFLWGVDSRVSSDRSH